MDTDPFPVHRSFISWANGQSDAYSSDPPWQMRALSTSCWAAWLRGFCYLLTIWKCIWVPLVIYVSWKIIIIRQNDNYLWPLSLKQDHLGNSGYETLPWRRNLPCLHLITPSMVEGQNASKFSISTHPEHHMGNKSPSKQKIGKRNAYWIDFMPANHITY